MKTKNLKLAIDNESVGIYIDNGETQDPVYLYYWHIEEWEEDSNIAIAVFKAIDLFHTNKQQLLDWYKEFKRQYNEKSKH